MRKNKGMSLLEVLVVSVVGMLLVGVVLSMWYFGYKNWTISRISSGLRIDLQNAIERIREEIRLSSLDYMSFYPSGAVEYTAISFPLPKYATGGFLTLDETSGKITWDKSVIYHVSSGRTKLLRTEKTFKLDSGERYTQLAAVVAAEETAGTKVVLESLDVAGFTITPKIVKFDGYNPSFKQSDKVNFGSIKLEPGAHKLRFTATGKRYDDVGNYRFGIDTLSITPSGCEREAENCAVVAGETTTSYSTELAGECSGNSYVKCAANEDEYITFSLYYDLWRESNFENSIRNNTILTDDQLRIKLATQDEGGEVCWQAAAQTGSESNALTLGTLPANIAVRNVLKGIIGNDFIDVLPDQKMVSIKFVAHPTSDFIISAAYLAERSGVTEDAVAGTTVPLAFGGLAGVTILQGTETWSDWLQFSMVDSKDYLVTFFSTAPNVSYWAGPEDATNSYYGTDPNDDSLSDISDASDGDWEKFTPSEHIYAAGSAENWANTGTIKKTYDTKIASTTEPEYGVITWDSSVPVGTTVSMKVRASDNSDMSGATEASITSSGDAIPTGLDGKRYVQFEATLTSSTPYTAYPWIDNVAINWEGAAKMCEIGGYFTQDSDYGIIELTVDGKSLTKGLEVTVGVSEYFSPGDTTYKESLTAEIEPRNAGR